MGRWPWEEEAIVELFETRVPVDLSHRKLAHRGSYIAKVRVSPSTVDRVQARRGLRLKGGPQAPAFGEEALAGLGRVAPQPLWCWDGSKFERCLAVRLRHRRHGRAEQPLGFNGKPILTGASSRGYNLRLDAALRESHQAMTSRSACAVSTGCVMKGRCGSMSGR